MNQIQTKPNQIQGLIVVLFVLIVLLASCKSNTGDSSTNPNESLPEEKNIVETVVLKKQDFTREIISNPASVPATIPARLLPGKIPDNVRP